MTRQTMTRQLVLCLSLSMALTMVSAAAPVRNLEAQALAPGVFALTWEASPQDQGELRIERRLGGVPDYETVANVSRAPGQYIDRCDAERGQPVAYRVSDAGDAESSTPAAEALTRNSANLVIDGDFELPLGPVQQLTGISVTTSGTWSAAIVEGGLTPGGRCLQFSTSLPNVDPGFHVTSRRYIVTPRTSYEFSWWSTENNYGTCFGDGQGYALTRELVKSFYRKTASLYVQQATRQGQWVGSWAEPVLPEDIRYVYFVLRGQGRQHDQPIRYDNIAIIDRDIELLLETDVAELTRAAAGLAQRHQQLQLQEDVTRLNEQIIAQLRLLESPADMDIDTFLDARAELCEAIRSLRRLMVAFSWADAAATVGGDVPAP